MPASTVSGSRARQVMPGAGAVTPAPVIIELTVGDLSIIYGGSYRPTLMP